MSTGLKSLFIIIFAVATIGLFGFGAITKFVFKQILFTPYNIVGIIMTIVSICGGYITKREGHWLRALLTALSSIISIFSFVCMGLSWFDINLFALIWEKILSPAVVGVGTVLMWILIVVIAVVIVAFIIYEIVKLTIYIKEARKWRLKQKDYESQKNLIAECSDDDNKERQKKEEASSDANENSIVNNQTSYRITEKEQQDNNKQASLPSDYELMISNNLCPKCGWYLKKRTNGDTGVQFRGCCNFKYNHCTFTISDEEFIRIYRKYH